MSILKDTYADSFWEDLKEYSFTELEDAVIDALREIEKRAEIAADSHNERGDHEYHSRIDA